MKSISFYSLLSFLFLLSCTSSKQLAKDSVTRIYVGTNTGSAEEGIYSFQFNTETGACTFEHKTKLLNPSFLCLSANNKQLYALNKVEGQKEGSIAAFAIEAKTGALQFLNRQSTEGRGACYVGLDASGKYAMAANYSSGSASIFPLQKDGSLSPASSTVQHEGTGPNKERQEGPHAHYINHGPDNLILAVDLGIDKVMLYQIDQKTNTLNTANPASITLGAGAGPRHIDFHSNGKWLYVLNELEGSLTVFERDANNAFKNLQTISSLPAGFSGYNKSADIHVHPSGKFVYGSNRGDHNSIAAFRIDQQTGQLTLVEIEPEAIAWPRNFAISPDGQFLLSANRDTDSITIYKIDKETGALNYTGQKVDVPKPLCIKFATF